jgi:hypothetical protein
MKPYTILLSALLSAFSLAAQQSGASKIPPPPPPGPATEQFLKAQEIDIVATVLEKVIRQEFDRADTFVNIEKIQGSYLSGVGALFNISHPMPFFNYGSMYYGLSKSLISGQVAKPSRAIRPAVASAPSPAVKPGAPAKKPGATIATTDSQWIYAQPPAARPWNQPNAYTISTAGGDIFTASFDDPRFRDSVFMDKLPDLKKALGAFFANYAILLTKLAPEEKIGINWVFEQQQWGLRSSGSSCSLSASIRKQDVVDFRAGKLSAGAFEKRIQYNVTRCAQKTANNTELEIFGAILEKLYSNDISQSLIQMGPADYNTMQGFGFVVNLSFTEQPYNHFPAMPGYKQPEKSEQTLDFQQRLSIFKAQFPEQLIEYGRILKTLKPDEVLQVHVNFPFRWGEALKPGIIYTIPQTVLAAYDGGKISLADAVKGIRTEEKTN